MVRGRIAIVLAFLATSVTAQGAPSESQATAQKTQPQPASVEELEKQEQNAEAAEQLRKFLEKAESAKRSIDTLATAKRRDCIKAFGHADFCECLFTNLPWMITFPEYIQLVIMPRKELEAIVPAEYRDYIDVTRKTRDRCVAKHFAN